MENREVIIEINDDKIFVTTLEQIAKHCKQRIDESYEN